MKSEMNNGVPVTQVDILIVGAGPAGLAAAIAAKEAGVDSLIVPAASCASASTTASACIALRKS